MTIEPGSIFSQLKKFFLTRALSFTGMYGVYNLDWQLHSEPV